MDMCWFHRDRNQHLKEIPLGLGNLIFALGDILSCPDVHSELREVLVQQSRGYLPIRSVSSRVTQDALASYSPTVLEGCQLQWQWLLTWLQVPTTPTTAPMHGGLSVCLGVPQVDERLQKPTLKSNSLVHPSSCRVWQCTQLLPCAIP